MKGENRGRNNGNGVNGENRETDANGNVIGENRSVQTGDETPIIPWLVTMATAGLAAVYLAMRRRKLNSKHDA